jgi:hypothetical protein
MDAVAAATAAIAAQRGQQQFAVAAAVMKMSADAEAAVVQLIETGQQNLNQLANLAAGIGGSLDVSV